MTHNLRLSFILKGLFAALALFGFGSALLAQDNEQIKASKPMSLVDLISLDRLANPQMTADGETVFFTLAQADWQADKMIDHIWMRRMGEGQAIQLTNGSGGEAEYAISPNEDEVAFIAKRGLAPKNQIFLISTRGGEAIQLSNHETGVRSIRWAPNAKGIFFIASESTKERDAARKKLKDDIIRFDADTPHRHLWFQPAQGGDAVRLTKGDNTVTDYTISDDGSFSILAITPSPYLNDRTRSELFHLDLIEGSIKRLTNNDFQESGVDISPDGSMVAFTANASASENGYRRDYVNDKLFTLTLDDTLSLTQHLGDYPFEVNQVRFQNNEELFLLVNAGSQNQLHLYDLKKGKHRSVFEPRRRTILNWSYNRRGNHHTYRLAGPDTPGEIYRSRGVRAPKPVTAHFKDLRKHFKIPEVRLIQWQGEDGVIVEGFLTLPVGYVEGQRYPLIVQTHGGPASSDQWAHFRTSRNTEVMAGHGYAVLMPNYRGSTGYGDPFLRDMIAANGGYFNQAHKDVMAGVDAVIDMGIADPERLIKMGWSAGGHMTNKLITYTDRFKAASSGAGAVNWTSMIGQSDIRVWRLAWFDKYPHQKGVDLDLYLKNSPLFEIHKVTTPTLVLVGEKDVRVPPPQSQELYNALKANGVPTAFYIAPGEPHGWRRLSHRLFKGNIELDWFAKHALGTDYEFEESPFVSLIKLNSN